MLGSADLLAYAHKYSFELSNDISAYTIAKIPLVSLVNKKNQAYATRDAIDLLSKLLMYDHKLRITAREALMHPYFKHNDLFRHFIDHHQLDNYTSPADLIPINNDLFLDQSSSSSSSEQLKSSSSNSINDDVDHCSELATINASFSKRFWDYSLVKIKWSDESRFQRVLKIGRGYYGDVYLGRRTDNHLNRSYVIKVRWMVHGWMDMG